MKCWPCHETAARPEQNGTHQSAVRDFGYRKVNQEGSHIILQTDAPRPHRLAVPDHHSLRLGTLNAILNAVARAQGVDKRDVLDKL